MENEWTLKMNSYIANTTVVTTLIWQLHTRITHLRQQRVPHFVRVALQHDELIGEDLQVLQRAHLHLGRREAGEHVALRGSASQRLLGAGDALKV